MKKNIANKKENALSQNNSITTRATNKKITHNLSTTSNALSSKYNSTQIPQKQNNVNNATNNNNIIYDQEFISYINKLSDIIKTLHKSNNANFSAMKNILENTNKINSKNNLTNNTNNSKQSKNNNKEKDNNSSNNTNINYEENLNSINNSFNHIESAFHNFYINAVSLFKKMKAYKETAEIKKVLKNNNINNNTNNNTITEEEENKNNGNRNALHRYSRKDKDCLENNKKSLKQIYTINITNKNDENINHSIDKIIKKKTI